MAHAGPAKASPAKAASARAGPAKAGRYVPAVWIVAAALMVTAAACRREAPKPVEHQDDVVPVGAVAATRAAIRAVIHASGVVVPAEGGEFLVFAPEPTRLLEVTKAPGEVVKSGDLLARFDLPSAAQAVSRLAAEMAAAQAQVENARINQERVRGFVERGLVPRRDLEVVDRDLASAQDTFERARTAHAAAQAGVTRATIRAPFDGIVAARLRNPGDMILSTNDPVMRIVDPGRLEVIASIARDDQSRVVTGATARVAAVGTDMVRLTVAGRAPSPSSGASTNGDRPAAPEGMVPFRLVFASPHMLAVDMNVQLDIDAEERNNTVLVPGEAIIHEKGETVLFIASGSRAERRVVKTGLEEAARIEITDGVRAGELVITRGHLGLTDGAAITVAAGR